MKTRNGKLAWMVALALVLVQGLAQALAQPLAHGADAQAGRQKAHSAKCIECHGEQGISTVSGYPHLAGQHPDYLLKQLSDFRSGARKSPFMNIVASKLDAGDAADIVAYFAALPRKRNEADLAPAAAATAAAVARRLYLEGDAARALPACASCHGVGGGGTPDGINPALKGQQMFYLREQLLNWHLGLRNNSAARSMNLAADPLTQEEIDALARYIAGM